MRVFVSHSVQDKAFVEEHIVDFLEKQGIDTWYSPDDIKSACDWEETVRKALNKCDWFLVVLTPNAIASPWVRAEVHWAMDHRLEHVVPVLAKDCEWQDLHLMLRTRQLVFLNHNLEEGKAKLLSVWEAELRPLVSGTVMHNLLDEPVLCIATVCVITGSFVPIVAGMSEAASGENRSKVPLPELLSRADRSQLIKVIGEDITGEYFFECGDCTRVNFYIDKSGNVEVSDAYKQTFFLPSRATSTCCWYSRGKAQRVRLIGCDDGTLYFYPRNRPDNKVVLRGHKFPITSLSWSQTSVIVFGDSEGYVNIWSQRNYDLLHTIFLTSPVYVLNTDRERSRILAFIGDGHLYILDYEGAILSTVRVSERPVTDAKWVSSDYIACTTGSNIELWDYTKNRCLYQFPIDEGTITALQLEKGLFGRSLHVGFKEGNMASFFILDPKNPGDRMLIRQRRHIFSEILY